MINFIITYSTMSAIIIIITMWIKSSNIIFRNKKHNHNQTNFLEPIKIDYFDSDYQLASIIHNLYINCIFDITYLRILLPGKFAKYHGMKAIYIIFSTFTLNIITFITRYIKYIFSSKNITFFEFLYLNYNNKYDLRKIILIDNKWVTNPKFENLEKAGKIFFNGNKAEFIPSNAIFEAKYKVLQEWKTLNHTPEHINMVAIEHSPYNNKKLFHYGIENFTNNRSNNTSYMTDMNKALSNNWYGEIPTLIMHEGPDKPSTFFELSGRAVVEASQKKIKIDDISLSIIKCNNNEIAQHLPDSFIPNFQSFDDKIKTNIDIIHIKWDMFEKHTKEFNFTDDQAFQIFQDWLNS